jgi:16S rRNA (guanine(966)-N(2))-methyltransferase RsmD
MRIIGGTLKGRRFYPPADKWPTRPTTDISKEGLYNMLFSRIDFEDIDFLDLFGGTGNHCYEMISRGARSATYVDQFGQCVNFAKKMAKDLDIVDQMKIVRSDVRKFISTCDSSYDAIFAGPPYGLKWLDEIPDMILAKSLLKEDGLLILEHNPDHNFVTHSRFVETRNYGQTFFSFFK